MPPLVNLSHKLTVTTDGSAGWGGGGRGFTEGRQRSPLGREKEGVIGIVELSSSPYAAP